MAHCDTVPIGALSKSDGRLTPTYWVMHGFQNILLRALGLGPVWPSVAIVLASAVTFFLLTVWRFRFEQA